MQFEWDENKNKANKRKHGVSFEEAKFVLFDPYALTIEDKRDYSEIRYQTLGIDTQARVLMVIWTEKTSIIRIISAWKADKRQREIYERQRKY